MAGSKTIAYSTRVFTMVLAPPPIASDALGERIMPMKKSKAPTIKDVARVAGVSITTVSRVLNNDTYSVNEETRKRIKAVITELNYIPNAMARGIRGENTKTIGLIIQDIDNPYYPGIVRGVEEVAHQQGFSVFLANAHRSRSRLRQYLELMREKRVDGLILAGGGVARDAEEYCLFQTDEMKSVIIGKNSTGNCVSVQIDNILGGKMACEHLIQFGHRRIACVVGVSDSNTTVDREKGYRQALESISVHPEKKWIVQGNFIYEGGYAAVEKLPLGGKNGITAIFAQNDLMAIGVINSLMKKGYRIPDDISVVGFDGIPATSYVTPALTTIQVPFQEMGKKAMDALLKLLKDRKVEKTTIMPVTLTERMTVRRIV